MVWVFDGHVWNMKLLDPNVFMSFSLASLTELPAAILLALFLDRWGRRWMGFASMFLCGIFSFVALATPHGKFFSPSSSFSFFFRFFIPLFFCLIDHSSIEIIRQDKTNLLEKRMLESRRIICCFIDPLRFRNSKADLNEITRA